MKRFLFILAILLAMYPVKGQQKITAGEYFIDSDPGTGHGSHFTLPIASLDTTLNLSLPVNSISKGYHILNYRFFAAGHWGLTYSRSFYIQPAVVATPNIVAGEYFLDTDPGVGAGVPVTVASPSTDVTLSLQLSANGLSTGQHQLIYRFRDAAGHWGVASSYLFYVQPVPVTVPNIVAGEYYIDNDPGVGSGTPVSVASPSTNVTLNLSLGVNSLTSGQHSLVYRFLDAAGRWGIGNSFLFYVQPAPLALGNITYGEYYFDNDPGFGSGTSISITPGASVTSSFVIPAASIPSGFHNLLVRFQDQNGRWSMMESKMFVKVSKDSIANINKGEYFIDNEPGVGKGTAFSIPSASSNVTFNPSIPANGISTNKFHILHYRFETADGKWGETASQPFYVTDNKEKYYTPVNKVEFHADNNLDSARLRIDSVGIVMHGYTAKGSFALTPADNITSIGRHFIWARAIDYFGQYGPKYHAGEFVVTNDTTKGMLLGVAMNPDSTIMTSGTVEIYKDSSGVIVPFKTVTPDNTGNFLIGGIPQGTYLFLLKPNPIASPTAINTYYDQQPQWQMANFQNVNADTMFSDVGIKALKTQNLNGVTGLEGFISTDTKKSSGISISPDRLTGRPMKGASVVLVGKNTKGGNPLPSNVIAKTTTDSTGYYSFGNVPKGDYSIIIDILGVPLIDYYTISVDTIAVVKANLNYVVGTAGIQILSVGIPKTNNTLVYPNPSSGEINILFGNESGKTNLTIVDLSGKVVYQRTLDVIANTVTNLDLHQIGKGFFNLILENGTSRELKKIIIE